jgi:hypothetical protein
MGKRATQAAEWAGGPEARVLRRGTRRTRRDKRAHATRQEGERARAPGRRRSVPGAVCGWEGTCGGQVLPDSMGVRHPPWFFLQRAYWGLSTAAGPAADPPPGPEAADPDVAAEELRLRGPGTWVGDAVEVRGLGRTFARSGGRTLRAVDRLWMSARKGEVRPSAPRRSLGICSLTQHCEGSLIR